MLRGEDEDPHPKVHVEEQLRYQHVDMTPDQEWEGARWKDAARAELAFETGPGAESCGRRHSRSYKIPLVKGQDIHKLLSIESAALAVAAREPQKEALPADT